MSDIIRRGRETLRRFVVGSVMISSYMALMKKPMTRISLDFVHRCVDVGIKLNLEKLELRRPEITFMGHIASKDGLKTDPEKVCAISYMIQPTNCTELKRLIGTVNYLGKFIPRLSETLLPLTSLLHKDVSLESIGKKPLAKASRHIQNLLLQAQYYSYSLEYRAGKDIPVADTLSRAPLQDKQNIGNKILHVFFLPRWAVTGWDKSGLQQVLMQNVWNSRTLYLLDGHSQSR